MAATFRSSCILADRYCVIFFVVVGRSCVVVKVVVSVFGVVW